MAPEVFLTYVWYCGGVVEFGFWFWDERSCVTGSDVG